MHTPEQIEAFIAAANTATGYPDWRHADDSFSQEEIEWFSAFAAIRNTGG